MSQIVTTAYVLWWVITCRRRVWYRKMHRLFLWVDLLCLALTHFVGGGLSVAHLLAALGVTMSLIDCLNDYPRTYLDDPKTP